MPTSPQPPRPVWSNAHAALRRRCVVCNRPLQAPTAEADAYCSTPSCQTRKRFEDSAAQARAWRARRAEIAGAGKQRTAEMFRIAADRIGAEPEAVPHIIAPYLDRPLAPLDAKDRAAFFDHLGHVTEAAFAAPEGTLPAEHQYDWDDAPGFPRRVAEMEGEHPALDATCAACQGLCCTQGRAAHAFITARAISFLRQQRPDLTPEDVADLYARHLPEEAVVYSCLFHGAMGCTLPRALRSDMCNHWQCGPRTELRSLLQAAGADRAMAVSLSQDHLEHPEAGAAVARTVTATPEGLTFHDDLKVAALPDP